jgi:hypothetical protein
MISEGLGDLHVTEISTDGQVIHANFHPEDSEGYGTVINPFFASPVKEV